MTELNQSVNWNRHFSTIYDFFNRSKWSEIALAQTLWLWIQTQFKIDRPILCIDDTKALKIHANKIMACVGMLTTTNASKQKSLQKQAKNQQPQVL